MPLGVGLLAGAFFFGRYIEAQRWYIMVPPEFEQAWDALDLLAAHPDDPDKPQDVSGVTDLDVAALDDATVKLLLSNEFIETAQLSPDPRALFALGRVALTHDQLETAYDLLEMANAAGSAPAAMYLATFFEVEDPAQAKELLATSIEAGFSPASIYWDEIYPESPLADLQSKDGTTASTGPATNVPIDPTASPARTDLLPAPAGAGASASAGSQTY